MSQSEYEVITCSRRKARENVPLLVAIDWFSFSLIEKVSVVNQTQSEGQQNQNKLLWTSIENRYKGLVKSVIHTSRL